MPEADPPRPKPNPKVIAAAIATVVVIAGAVAFAPTPTMVNETQYSFDGYPTVWQSAVMSSADHSAVFSALAGATRRAILARP